MQTVLVSTDAARVILVKPDEKNTLGFFIVYNKAPRKKTKHTTQLHIKSIYSNKPQSAVDYEARDATRASVERLGFFGRVEDEPAPDVAIKVHESALGAQLSQVPLVPLPEPHA